MSRRAFIGRRPLDYVLVCFALVLALFVGFWIGGGFTGLIIHSPVVVHQPLDISFSSAGSAPVTLSNDAHSFSLYGVLTGSGRVYLNSENNSLLVLDSAKLTPDRPALSEEAAAVLSLINGSGVSSDGLSTSLAYGYSDFGDGFSGLDSFVSLDVSKSSVPSSGSVCTLWEVYSVDRAATNRFCFGGVECCRLSGFTPSGEKWNDSLDLYLSSHGASANNVVSAQVVSFDSSSSSSTLYGKISYGGWRSLPVFFQQPVYSFSHVCVDTCELDHIEGNLTLVADLDVNSRIDVNGVDYTLIRGFVLKEPSVVFENLSSTICFCNIDGVPIGSSAYNISGLDRIWSFNSLPEGVSGVGEKLDIYNLRNIPSYLEVKLLSDPRLSSSYFIFNDTFAFDSMKFELPLKKPGNVLLECASINYSAMTCSNWDYSEVAVSFDNGVAYFNASKLGVYAVASVG